MLKQIENKKVLKYMYMQIHSCINHNNPKVEAA